MKELFLKVWYPVFDTHLAATLTVSSEKDNKHVGMPLNWSLAIMILDQSPLGLFLSNMHLASFHSPYLGWKNWDWHGSLRTTAFSSKSNLFIGSLFLIFARDGYFKCWTWTPVTCIFFDCKFLKKYLLGVAYKAREHAILNHKNDKFCTFFSL